MTSGIFDIDATVSRAETAGSHIRMTGNGLLGALDEEAVGHIVLTEELHRRHFPLDRPIADVMSIGGGPDHEGHTD